MKQVFLKVSLITIFITKDLFALFGAGDIVSDPTSYTYYAKEIKAMNDQIKTALDQLEQINKANEALNKANDLIFNAGERIYNPTKQIKNLVRNVQQIQSRFKSVAERAKNMGAERFFKDNHYVEEPLETEIYEKWKNNMSALFNNSEDKTYQELREQILQAQKRKDYLKYQQAVENMTAYLKLKKVEQNAIKKSSLRAPIDLYQEYFANADVVQERNERQELITNLNTQIHNEKDLMKQQQTTNEILMLMLETIDKQYEMQMRYQYALAIPKFSNESISIEQELKTIQDERKNFNRANQVEKTPAIKETHKYLDDLAKKGEKSEIYEILSGDRDFQENY